MVFDQWAAQNHIPKRKLTPVDKLSFIGKRGMGAFEFIPATPGLESSSTLQIESLYQLARRIFEEREEISVQDDEALQLQSIYEIGTSAGGQHPKAIIAISGDLLHMEVRFDGEEINPLEFLTMLYGNIKALEHNSQMGINELDMNIPSPYDTDRQEIEALMLRFLPSYFEDLQQGAYSLPEHTEQSLRNIFSLGASKHYFYETMPSMANPLGIGNRCMPLATKVQNLLIADFLNYLAMRHQVYLSTMDEVLKKNSKSKP